MERNLLKIIFLSVLLLMVLGCDQGELEVVHQSGGEEVGVFDAANYFEEADAAGGQTSPQPDLNDVEGVDAEIVVDSGDNLDASTVAADTRESSVEDVFEPKDTAVPLDKDVEVAVDAAPVDPPVGECSNVFAIETLALVNAARVADGKSVLRCDPLLTRSARLHAEDMCAQNYFSHTSLDGRSMGDRIRAVGATFRAAGENIAKGQQSSQAAHNSWMNSPGHRANILSSKYDRLGVGHAQCASGRYWVQNFAG